VAMIFNGMRKSRDIHVHGHVSPGLLRNIEEFQAVWHCWLGRKYSKVEISADIERYEPRAIHSESAIMAFSGGADSCFTAWRHSNGTCGRSKRNLPAAMMMHGFDIPLEEENVFRRAVEKSQKMLAPLGVTLIPLVTNFRALGDDWTDAHAAGLASCLMLLEGGYEVGLIASSPPYNNISISPPWGSNPLTDRLLSSDTFEIIHDGAGFTRAEKIYEISNWPQALKYLRVCWEGPEKDRNCCRCEKCIRTIMNFRLIGLPLPECFEEDVTESQIAGIRGLNEQHLFDYRKMLSIAEDLGIDEPWVGALGECIKRNENALNRSRGIWPQLRKKVKLRTRLRKMFFSLRKQKFFEKAAV